MRKRSVFGLAILALSLGLILLASHQARAAFPAGTDFIVISGLDQVDNNIGDGVCNTATGVCTLRAAIQEANILPGKQKIGVAASVNMSLTGQGDENNNTGDFDIVGDLEINGDPQVYGLTFISGNFIDRVFDIFSGNVTISNLWIVQGNPSNDGVYDGGGIYNQANLTLNNVRVAFNISSGFGGNILNANGATLTINNSTLDVGKASIGGGLSNYNSSADLTNVTFYQNEATGPGGGGIDFDNSGGTGASVKLTNVTFEDNYKDSGLTGGSIYIVNADNLLSLKNTILKKHNSSAGNCFGIVNSAGYNIANDNSCNLTSVGDQNNLDPLISNTEAMNGGFTPTIALLPGSPAIDAGTSSGAPSTDQRGISRPQGLGFDIGAFELEVVVSPTPTPSVTPSATPSPTPSVSPSPSDSPTPTPSVSPSPANPTVSIAPFAIGIAVTCPAVPMSAQLLDQNGQPITTGITSVDWGMSSTNSIGTITNINGLTADFQPLNTGSGNIFVTIWYNGNSYIGSIPVTVDTTSLCLGAVSPTPTPSVSPSPSDSPTPTPSVSPSPSDVPTPTPSVTPTPSDNGNNNSNSDSTNHNSAGEAPKCTDQKPGSAPVLNGASVTGDNEVTLYWSKANDPVTYYLITYGNKPGEQAYGNPNVGNKNTTQYTVKNLSGGQTYYFKVRSGNGCQPGEFSNELAATPGGGQVSGPASGFAAGVLGETTEEEASPTPAPSQEATNNASMTPSITPEVKGAVGTCADPWWKGLLLIANIVLQAIALFIALKHPEDWKKLGLPTLGISALLIILFFCNKLLWLFIVSGVSLISWGVKSWGLNQSENLN